MFLHKKVMKIPDIVQKASSYPLIYVGNYQGRDVYARIPPEVDNGSGTGYPFVYLYDGKQVEEVCIGTDNNLALWFFENA